MKSPRRPSPRRRPFTRSARAPGLLGPTCDPELASIGIHTLDDLRDLGWEEACIRWAEAYPLRLNVNAFYGIVAAIEGVDWRDLDQGWRARIRALKARLARDLGPPAGTVAVRRPGQRR
jgi:hypothetical protein